MSQLALVEIEPEYIPVNEQEPAQSPVPQIPLLGRGPWWKSTRPPGQVPSRDFYLPGDRGDPPRRAGKIQPRRLSPLTWLKAVPGFLSQWESFPGEFWYRDQDAAGPLAIVACPCGQEAVVPLSHTKDCDCGCIYWNLGDRVLVFGGA